MPALMRAFALASNFLKCLDCTTFLGGLRLFRSSVLCRMPGSGLKRWLRHFVGETSGAKDRDELRCSCGPEGPLFHTGSAHTGSAEGGQARLRQQLLRLFLSRARIV